MNPVILSFVGVLVSILLITGCDDISRFSYENYSCQPRQSSIYEITISDLKKRGIINYFNSFGNNSEGDYFTHKS